MANFIKNFTLPKWVEEAMKPVDLPCYEIPDEVFQAEWTNPDNDRICKLIRIACLTLGEAIPPEKGYDPSLWIFHEDIICQRAADIDAARVQAENLAIAEQIERDASNAKVENN